MKELIEFIAKAMAKIVARYKYLVLTEHVPALAGFVPNVDIATGAGTRLMIGSGVVLTNPPTSRGRRNFPVTRRRRRNT